jgi:hypothetical protein
MKAIYVNNTRIFFFENGRRVSIVVGRIVLWLQFI